MKKNRVRKSRDTAPLRSSCCGSCSDTLDFVAGSVLAVNAVAAMNVVVHAVALNVYVDAASVVPGAVAVAADAAMLMLCMQMLYWLLLKLLWMLCCVFC